MPEYDSLDSWGRPVYANDQAPLGPAQMTEVAQLAMARGARQFATQAAAIAAAASAPAGVISYGSIDTMPGMSARFDGAGAIAYVGIGRFADAAALAAAITTPATDMLVKLTPDRFLRRYNGTAWRPFGAEKFPVMPTSVAGTGVTLGADGAVTIAAGGATASINGCFTSDFDHYLIILKVTLSGNIIMSLRFRAAGADLSGATDYVHETFSRVGVTLTGAAAAASSTPVSVVSSSDNRIEMHIYNPVEAEATYYTGGNSASNTTSAAGANIDGRHIGATTIDGFSLTLPSGTITAAKVTVYGYNDN